MSDTAPSPFSISVVQREDDVVVVSVAGELDIATADELRAHLDRLAVGPAARVVVDLSELEFIDSGGLNVLAVAARALEAGGGSLVLASPAPAVAQVFEVVNLASQVPIEPSLEAAVGRVTARAEA